MLRKQQSITAIEAFFIFLQQKNLCFNDLNTQCNEIQPILFYLFLKLSKHDYINKHFDFLHTFLKKINLLRIIFKVKK